MIPAPALVESNGHRFEDTAYNNYIADTKSEAEKKPSLLDKLPIETVTITHKRY